MFSSQSRRLKWGFLIKICQLSVVLVVVVNFSSHLSSTPEKKGQFQLNMAQNILKGLLSRFQTLNIWKKILKPSLLCVFLNSKCYLLYVLAVQSLNFSIVHILLGNFSRHICDVISVNWSMKRESVKGLVWIFPINYQVKWCIVRHSGIPTCIGKDVGRPQGYGQYFTNVRPLWGRRIIVCVLVTLQGTTVIETLTNKRSMATMRPVWVWNPMLFSTSIYISKEKIKMWFCHPDFERPALSAQTADVCNLLVFKSNNIFLYYFAFYRNDPETDRNSLQIH